MEQKRRIVAWLIALGASSVATQVDAATFRVDLPELAGAYEQPGDRRATAFDIGTRLVAIESITIELTVGDADTGGLCTASIPAECTAGTVLDLFLSAGTGESLSGGFRGIAPRSVGQTRIFPGGRLDPGLGMVLDPWPQFLFAGRASVDLALVGIRGPGTIPPGFHRADVLSVTIVIEGTPVPSPSVNASILLGLGLLGAHRRSRLTAIALDERGASRS